MPPFAGEQEPGVRGQNIFGKKYFPVHPHVIIEAASSLQFSSQHLSYSAALVFCCPLVNDTAEFNHEPESTEPHGRLLVQSIRTFFDQ